MTKEHLSLTQIDKQDLAIINEFYKLERQAKAIKVRQADLRADLVDIMEDYGVKSWENDHFKVTYIGESQRKSIDSTRLKKEAPEVFEEFQKTSTVKPSVRVTVK